MSGVRLVVGLLGALAWVVLEPTLPGRIGFFSGGDTGFVPDLLLVLGVCLSAHPRAGFGPVVALGALRELVAGGTRGAFLFGYPLALLTIRAIFGRRGAEKAGLFALTLAFVPATLVAHLPAAALGVFAGADLQVVALVWLRGAAATALFSVVVTAPLWPRASKRTTRRLRLQGGSA
jgi:cell shape-determining protein MreD